jgi:hypothetical protein
MTNQEGKPTRLEILAAKMRHDSMRVGIERSLVTRWRYLIDVRNNYHSVPDEEFYATIAEMTAEGLITQQPGRSGGVRVTVNNGVNKEAVNE